MKNGSTPYFGRRNLVAREGIRFDGHPSEARPERPPLKTKEAYRAWCADPATDHAFISLVEPENPRAAVNADNPPRLLHGVIADYDSPRVAEMAADMGRLVREVAKAVPYFEAAPAYACRTWSGKARLVWEFEEPVPASNGALLKAFLKAFRDESKARMLLPGLDLKAWENPGQYYEIGTEWTPVPCGASAGPRRVPADTARRLLFDASRGLHLAGDGHASIPMDVVAAEVGKRWPGRWPGAFEPGARGPLFWIDDGIGRTGCQVTPDGMVCYSDRAGSPFLSWKDILGAPFVREFEEKRIREASKDVWFLTGAGRYLLKDPAIEGHWITLSKEDYVMRLKKAGYTNRPVRKGAGLSEIEDALVTIQNTRAVDGVAPFIFNKAETVVLGGETLLNNSTLRSPMAPADDGDERFWPFLWKWFDEAFVDTPGMPRTKEFVWAWFKRFWQEAFDGHPKAGHALILAGPVNAGKSLFGARIVGGAMGGFEDVGEVLVEGHAFNKAMAHSAVWMIDDQKAAATARDAKRFAEAIKKAVASPWVNYHPKYMDAKRLPWKGRVVLTTNLDFDSLEIIPRLDGSILDKLMLVRMKEDFRPDFPPDHVLEPMILAELPHFLAFLRDWTPPPEIAGATARFGLAPIHDQDLVERAREMNPEHRTTEAIDFWKRGMADSTKPPEVWEGTSTALLAEFGNYPNMAPIIKSYSPISLGKALVKIAQYRPDITSRKVHNTLVWRIDMGAGKKGEEDTGNGRRINGEAPEGIDGLKVGEDWCDPF